MSTTLSYQPIAGVLPSKRTPRTAPDRPVRSVLVASNADAGSRAAARVARELVHAHAAVHVVAVQDTLRNPSSRLLTGDDGQPASDSLATLVRQQLDGCGCERWPVEILHGEIATSICHAAHEHEADLIVVGLNEHGMLDRALHRETTLRVLRHASVPVLAVVPWAIGRPRVIVCGVDFSPASLGAARLAAALGGPECLVILVHAVPDQERSERAFSKVAANGAEAALGRLARDIAVTTGARVERMVRHGPAAAELAAVAAWTSADLIAVGARRGGATPTVFGSSVRASLAREATRSLLVVPAQQQMDTE